MRCLSIHYYTLDIAFNLTHPAPLLTNSGKAAAEAINRDGVGELALKRGFTESDFTNSARAPVRFCKRKCSFHQVIVGLGGIDGLPGGGVEGGDAQRV